MTNKISASPEPVEWAAHPEPVDEEPINPAVHPEPVEEEPINPAVHPEPVEGPLLINKTEKCAI